MPTWAASSTSRPTRDVVADLHEVVDLGAGADPRLAHRGAVDGGVGADLDVVLDHHRADLRHLDVRPSASRVNPNPSLPMTAPSWTTTRSPSTTRSRIETWAWTWQSRPITAPAPTATWLSRMLPAPTRAPAPMATNGPIVAVGSTTAPSPMAACGLIPGAGRGGVWKIASARAKARNGLFARSSGRASAGASSATITAPARVAAASAL